MFSDLVVFSDNDMYHFEPKKGCGSYLYNNTGDKILDFSTNVGKNILGYAHPSIEKAIIEQLKVGLYSQPKNLINSMELNLKNKLCRLAGFSSLNVDNDIIGDVVFTNSAIEANTIAMQIARIRYNKLCDRDYNEIICLHGSNHKNLLFNNNISSVNSSDKPETTFPWFKYAEINNIQSVERMITEHTCAIMIETVQYNNGIKACDQLFLKQIRELSTKHEILLIIDETYCGGGRTGTFFTYQKYGIIPDIVTVSSGIAGGFPLSACILNKKYIKYTPLTTYNGYDGGQLLLHISDAVIDIITNDKTIANIDLTAKVFSNYLKQIEKRYANIIQSCNSYGLAASIKLCHHINCRKFAQILFSNRLLVDCIGTDTVLLSPPLTVSVEETKIAIKTIALSLEEIAIIERY